MDKSELKMFELIREDTQVIAEALAKAEEARARRAKNMKELDERRFSLREIGEAAGGMTHAGVRQSIQSHGPGSEKAKQIAAERRKRNRAAAKTGQPDRQG